LIFKQIWDNTQPDATTDKMERSMSVRKRILPRTGATRWYVDYRDQAGKRRAKQFGTKAEVVSFETTVRGELRAGTHVADSASITVAEAGELWLQRAQIEQLEASTVRQYRQHLKTHIVPLMGTTKLSRLSKPVAEEFRDRLLEKCSRALARAVLTSFKGVVKEAQRRGLVGYNAATDTNVKLSKRKRTEMAIPSKDDIRAMLNRSAELWPITRIEITRKQEKKVVAVSWRPILVTAIFTGLRCSELRGLTWEHVDFSEGVIRVRQRADFENRMGPPKSAAGNREVPMAPLLVNTLKAWKLACPQTALELVFPNENGGIHSTGNIHTHYWKPLQRKLGLVSGEVAVLDKAGNPKLGKDGKPIMRSAPRYTFHSLRHAAASLFIEQGWSPKKVQTIMGHASIQVTFDTYGHLWKNAEDDAKAMAQIETRLLG
jgi:integrase